ncbi:hypothetical protein FJY71_01335 [candidate division WOR-3 bacterium]|nr:hypothetical protein [candidate division WOR-3 bacterium]
MQLSSSLWVWVGAILTFGIFSFLLKDNPFYKFCEHLFVGVSLGYTMTIVTWSTLWPDLFKRLFASPTSEVSIGAKLLLLVPLALGILYFFAFVPKVSWLMRIPMSFVLGWSAGVIIPSIIQTSVLTQAQYTVLKPGWMLQDLPRQMGEAWNHLAHVKGFNSVSDALLSFLWAIGPPTVFIGAVAAVIYFFFSREQKGLLKPVSGTGIIFLMVGFGASFGYTVMARMSLLIDRLQFLLRDWLGVIR